jgi:hypothetical protein
VKPASLTRDLVDLVLTLAGLFGLLVAGVFGGLAVTALALGVLCLWLVHARWTAALNEKVDEEIRGNILVTRRTAAWMQTIGRRTGQMKGDSWVCPHCLQSEVGWVETCGRCGHPNDHDNVRRFG